MKSWRESQESLHYLWWPWSDSFEHCQSFGPDSCKCPSKNPWKFILKITNELENIFNSMIIRMQISRYIFRKSNLLVKHLTLYNLKLNFIDLITLLKFCFQMIHLFSCLHTVDQGIPPYGIPARKTPLGGK